MNDFDKQHMNEMNKPARRSIHAPLPVLKPDSGVFDGKKYCPDCSGTKVRIVTKPFLFFFSKEEIEHYKEPYTNHYQHGIASHCGKCGSANYLAMGDLK